MIEIKRISYLLVSQYKNLVKKERVTLENPEGAVWIGAFEDGELTGFNCIVINQKTKKARIKSSFVFPEHRKKKIFNQLMRHTLAFAWKYGIKKITAFCTPMSVGTFLRYGFVKQKEKKGGIVFVTKERADGS